MSKQFLNKKFTAFTLAEVLITLLIIGVIASIVIPGIVQDSQNAELKSAFKKAYSTASNAWKLVVAENPSTYTNKGGWGSCDDPDDDRSSAFKAKFSVIKSCINEDGCWAKDFEFPGLIGNGLGSGWEPKRFSWIASDGMCWAVPWRGYDDSVIAVDTNCEKKPNLIGKDIFSFLLGSDGIVYFTIDDTSTTGRPMSKGKVCPWADNPTTINGRSVDFKSWLIN